MFAYTTSSGIRQMAPTLDKTKLRSFTYDTCQAENIDDLSKPTSKMCRLYRSDDFKTALAECERLSFCTVVDGIVKTDKYCLPSCTQSEPGTGEVNGDFAQAHIDLNYVRDPRIPDQRRQPNDVPPPPRFRDKGEDPATGSPFLPLHAGDLSNCQGFQGARRAAKWDTYNTAIITRQDILGIVDAVDSMS